jgi:hypothetical protein
LSEVAEHLKAIVEHISESTEKHYAWVRQMLALCTGSLTLLVALHKSFVPESPTVPWLLQATWIGLGVSVALAAIILHGEAVHLRDRAAKELETFFEQVKSGERKVSVDLTDAPKRYEIAGRAFPWVLAVSLISLVCFALFNVGCAPPTAGTDQSQVVGGTRPTPTCGGWDATVKPGKK